jgi:hypothetical protein
VPGKELAEVETVVKLGLREEIAPPIHEVLEI